MSETTQMGTSVVHVHTPDSAALLDKGKRALALAQSMVIDSPVMYETAAEELQSIKARAAALDTQRKSITKPLDDAKAAVMALFKPPLEFLSEAERVIKGSMLTYQREQEALRQQEQARLEAAARAERERLEAEAAALRESGRAEEAEVKADIAAMVSAPVVETAVKAAGVAVRKTWSAEVTDKAALLAHVAQHPEFLDLLIVDNVVLRGLARSLKDKLNLPGVRVFEDATLSSRKA